MNQYFVSAARGSDSSGDGSATNPWKTIGKAIGATSGVSLGVGGARVYVEPGTYYESVTLALSPTATTPLEIVGDCDGAGFLAGGHPAPKTGVVDWSGWSDDFTPSASAACLFATAKGYVTLRNLKLIGGAVATSCVTTNGDSPGWTFAGVAFVPYPNRYAARIAVPAGSPLGWTFDRCTFQGSVQPALRIDAARHSSEYSLGVAFRNCRLVAIGGLSLTATGTGDFLATGVVVEHCTFSVGSRSIDVYTGVTTPLTTPVRVRGCFFTSTAGIEAGHASHVAEDWNDFCCPTPRTNVAAGANSRSSVRPAIDLEDGLFDGTPLRPRGTPTPGSPLAGRVGSGSYPPLDATGRNRPEGCGSPFPATGALERHDTGEPNTAYADAGSAACLALRGPSSLERPILLDAAPTTISVKVRWDGNHGDAKKPRVILVANPEIGIAADQVLIATTTSGTGATPNAFETLTFAPVTPTKAGAIMLRFISRSATGTGVAYFDSITLA